MSIGREEHMHYSRRWRRQRQNLREKAEREKTNDEEEDGAALVVLAAMLVVLIDSFGGCHARRCRWRRRMREI